jgi:PAS domain-containing protein
MPRESTTPPVWDANRLRIATDAAGVALWSWHVDTNEIALDERAHRLWGVPSTNGPVTFKDLSSHIHPQDLDRVRAAFTATRHILGAYEIDFRIMHGTDWAGSESTKPRRWRRSSMPVLVPVRNNQPGPTP